MALIKIVGLKIDSNWWICLFDDENWLLKLILTDQIVLCNAQTLSCDRSDQVTLIEEKADEFCF